MKTINVNIPNKAYPVYIADGLLERAGELSSPITGVCKAAVITDDIVEGLYAKRLESSLEKAGFETVRYVFPNGEKSKNTDNLISILNFLSERSFSSSDAVFALGGGVAGDIAGFAAAVYLRGINFVQVPTTLLAAVDSSVGGKTAVDLKAGKNMAGAFYQPKLVICDCSVLETLDKEQISNGFAEIIKYAFIKDRELFNILTAGNSPNIADIIARCVTIKRDIVVSDELDTGVRHILNFGHTFAHAIEKQSGFTVSHGKAVSIGMSVITRASVKMGICDKSCYDGLKKTLEMYSLPLESVYGADDLYAAAISDKKRKGDNITLVLPEKIGKCVLKTVPLREMKEFLKLGIE